MKKRSASQFFSTDEGTTKSRTGPSQDCRMGWEELGSLGPLGRSQLPWPCGARIVMDYGAEVISVNLRLGAAPEQN